MHTMRSKAQTTIETLIMLAIAVFILGYFTSVVYDQVYSGFVRAQQKEGSDAVRLLAGQINDAYFLGPGTVKSVIITIPQGVDSANSFISGKSVVMRVAGTDFVASTNAEVRGSWPNSDGSYVFVLTAYSDFVAVSAQNVLFTPSQITETIQQNSSRDKNILVSNSSNASKSFSIYSSFPSDGSTDANVVLAQSSVSINANSDTNVRVAINCSRNSFGSYYGAIIFVPASSADANLSLPVNLVCSPLQQRLGVFPSSKTITVTAGSFSSTSLLVCNSSSSAFSSSSASVSGAIAGNAWTGFSGAISANTCRTLTLNINAPSSAGAYTGRVTVFASGFSSYSDLNIVAQ